MKKESSKSSYAADEEKVIEAENSVEDKFLNAEEVLKRTGNRFLIYGSLRPPINNRYQKSWTDAMDFKDFVKVPGMGMVSVMGHYPAAYLTGNDDDFIYAETVEVTDERVANSIISMEVFAGYYLHPVKINGQEYCIFLYPEDRASTLTRVNTPSWVEYYLGSDKKMPKKKVEAKKPTSEDLDGGNRRLYAVAADPFDDDVADEPDEASDIF